MNKLERLKKYANGGKIAKLENGGLTPREKELEEIEKKKLMGLFAYENAQLLTNLNQKQEMMSAAQLVIDEANNGYEMLNPQMLQSSTKYLPQTKVISDSSQLKVNLQSGKMEGNIGIREEQVNPEEFFSQNLTQPIKKSKPENIEGNASGGLSGGAYAAIGGAATAAINAVDGAVIGDKNFSASSQAIDTAVHGASSALIKSGNPYAMAAGVALEGLNFATKAGGKNVQGFDVGINNSGYGNLGHMESEAGRVWDSWSGATSRKLAKRNEQARMALAAADISDDIKFEQEARQNSVTNILQLNKIALAGGIDTSLLAN